MCIYNMYIYIYIYITACQLFLRLIHQHSRIPLTQHPWEWTSARLSNILDYQTVPIPT